MGREQVVGWALAALAMVVATVQWGWRGAILGLTVVVFWLLLQFSRALRAMRMVADKPVGRVPSAVMFQSKLAAGQPLVDVLRLAGSLGQQVDGVADTFRWGDDAGDAVEVVLRQGRVVRWALRRTDAPNGPG